MCILCALLTLFQSPFNTYTTVGLPPTPIANPGIDAIKAVAKPAKTNYLFFVVKNYQGYHSFSPNLKKHNLYNTGVFTQKRFSKL